MAKIMIEIKNDGAKCGRCATTKMRKYGDGTEIARLWCNIFGKYLPDDFKTGFQTIDRLPECIAAEEGYYDLITEIF